MLTCDFYQKCVLGVAPGVSVDRYGIAAPCIERGSIALSQITISLKMHEFDFRIHLWGHGVAVIFGVKIFTFI